MTNAMSEEETEFVYETISPWERLAIYKIRYKIWANIYSDWEKDQEEISKQFKLACELIFGETENEETKTETS